MRDGDKSAPWCMRCRKALRNDATCDTGQRITRIEEHKLTKHVTVHFAHDGCGGFVVGSYKEFDKCRGATA